jgi:hypothetical protein
VPREEVLRLHLGEKFCGIKRGFRSLPHQRLPFFFFAKVALSSDEGRTTRLTWRFVDRQAKSGLWQFRQFFLFLGQQLEYHPALRFVGGSSFR